MGSILCCVTWGKLVYLSGLPAMKRKQEDEAGPSGGCLPTLGAWTGSGLKPPKTYE